MKKIFSSLMLLSLAWVNAQTNATKLEYFLDSDNGVGLNNVVNITPGENVTAGFTVTIPAGTSLGFHKLYVRVKDVNGWSHTVRTNLEIIPQNQVNNVIKGEYFIDSDPSVSQAVSFSVSPQSIDVTQNFLSNLQGLPVGFHKLYGRVKDSQGNWSHTFRRNIEVIEAGNAEIVEIEYFFGSDPEFGNAVYVAVATPQEGGSFTFNVPYPVGEYEIGEIDKLFIRAKDSNGKWSHTTILDEISNPLAIDNTDKMSITLYPNPVVDNLTIKTTDSEPFNFVLYNSAGKQLVDKIITTVEQIDMSSYSAGMYFAYLWKADSKTVKVVKIMKK